MIWLYRTFVLLQNFGFTGVARWPSVLNLTSFRWERFERWRRLCLLNAEINEVLDLKVKFISTAASCKGMWIALAGRGVGVFFRA